LSRVSTAISRQFSISASSPSDSAAFRKDWSVLGVSIAVSSGAQRPGDAAVA
jgi:hypothetical protein